MMSLSSMVSLFDDEQRLTKLNRVAALCHDRGHASAAVGFDLIHHLHRFDDAQHLSGLDFVADLNKSLGSGGGTGIERADHRSRDHVLIGPGIWRCDLRRRGGFGGWQVHGWRNRKMRDAMQML